MEAKIDTNRETKYDALKDMQTENERHGEWNRFSSLQNGGRQKNQSGRNECHNMWSEVDETILQQVGNIMTHN
jgi:hypothetical protein